MKADLNLEIDGLNTLIQANKPFFLYRRPGATTWVLAMFDTNSVHQLTSLDDLNDRQGYVIAPFDLTSNHPIVLLTDPKLYTDQEAITVILTQETASTAHQATNDQSTYHQTSDALSEQYHRAYVSCMDTINKGLCQKIVLSRQENKTKPSSFSAARLFNKACATYPEAFVYLCHTALTGTWLGSSPEPLLEEHDNRWLTVALAGTQTSNQVDTSRWDSKNQDEQRMVADHVEAVLERFGLHAEKAGPVNSQAGKLTHLKTTYQFNLTNQQCSRLGTLLADLHPTPATCGWPTDKAQEALRRYEQHDRAYYAGFLGPYQVNGHTALYVNLRCMNIKADQLILYAGGGLLAGSTEDTEWAETAHKIETLLSLID